MNQKEKINIYQENVQSKMQEIEEETNITEDWQNLKQVILEAVMEYKLSKDVKNANHWWDDECKRAIQKRMKQEENV